MHVQIISTQNVDLGSTQTVTGAKTLQNLTVSTNALNLTVGQISFPSTQNPSAGSNVLDDYEEGTWTPTDASGAGLGLTVTSATYSKVGRIVICHFNVTYPATADGTGALFGGLPFTASTADNFQGGIGTWNNGSKNITHLVLGGTQTMNFRNNGANADFTNANLSGQVVRGTIMYEV